MSSVVHVGAEPQSSEHRRIYVGTGLCGSKQTRPRDAWYATQKKTSATSDVAPAEENLISRVLVQAARAGSVSGRRDNRLTPTKLTNATARL